MLTRCRPLFLTRCRPLFSCSYGLIAEEVAKVFPDLVVYDKGGKPETIKYRLPAPMLLNELQKEHRTVEELKSDEAAEHARETALEGELSSLEALVAASHGAPATPGQAPASLR